MPSNCPISYHPAAPSHPACCCRYARDQSEWRELVCVLLRVLWAAGPEEAVIDNAMPGRAGGGGSVSDGGCTGSDMAGTMARLGGQLPQRAEATMSDTLIRQQGPKGIGWKEECIAFAIRLVRRATKCDAT